MGLMDQMDKMATTNDIRWILTSSPVQVLRSLAHDDVACPTTSEHLQQVLGDGVLRTEARYALVLVNDFSKVHTGCPPALVYVCFDGSVVVQICHPGVNTRMRNLSTLENKLSDAVRAQGLSPHEFTPIWQGDVIQSVFDMQAGLQKNVNYIINDITRATASFQE
jgi:hypothetical protein